MNYLDLVTKASAASARLVPRYFAPATEQQLLSLGDSLRRPLPTSLSELLRQTDGVGQRLIIGPELTIDDLWLVLPTSEIGLERMEAGSALVRFAFAGVDGISFVFLPDGEHVGAWYPQEGRLTPVADSLAEFLVGWLSGHLKV